MEQGRNLQNESDETVMVQCKGSNSTSGSNSNIRGSVHTSNINKRRETIRGCLGSMDVEKVATEY